MVAISTLSRSMVGRKDIRADIVEAIDPLKEHIGHIALYIGHSSESDR